MDFEGDTVGENGPLRCLRFAGALMRMEGEPLALGFVGEGALICLDEQGNLRAAKQIGGKWEAGKPLLLDQLAGCASLCPAQRLVILSSANELGVWAIGKTDPRWWMDTGAWITATAGHPTLPLVASGHDDGAVRVWDALSGELIQCWEASHLGDNSGEVKNKAISVLAWDNLEKRLLVADESLEIHHLEVGEPSPLYSCLGHKGRVVALGFDPLGRYIYSAGWDGTVRVWSNENGSAVILLNNHAALVTCLAFSSDGKWLLAGDNLPSWNVWEVGAWRRERAPSLLGAEPRHISLSPSGALAAISLQDGRLLSVDWKRDISGEGRIIKSVVRPRPSISCLGNGDLYCLSPEGGVQRWQATKGLAGWKGSHQAQHVADFSGPVHALAVNPNGSSLATAQNTPAHVRLWKSSEGEPGLKMAGGYVSGPGGGELLAISSDGKKLAIGSSQSQDIVLVDGESLAPFSLVPDPLEGASPQDLAFSACGQFMAVCGVNTLASKAGEGSLLVLDANTGKSVWKLARGFWRLAWHPDGVKLALSGPEGGLVMFDVGSGEPKTLLNITEMPLTVLGFSSQGHYLVASCGNEELLVYSIAKGKPLGTLALPGSVVAVSAGMGPDEVVVLLAGGDGWSIDLPAWLAEQSG